MKGPVPKQASDQEAGAFVAGSDLTDYDLSGMHLVRFEFQPKSGRTNMRLPCPPLDAVKASAARAGVPLSAVHPPGAGTGRAAAEGGVRLRFCAHPVDRRSRLDGGRPWVRFDNVHAVVVGRGGFLGLPKQPMMLDSDGALSEPSGAEVNIQSLARCSRTETPVEAFPKTTCRMSENSCFPTFGRDSLRANPGYPPVNVGAPIRPSKI